MLRAMDAGAARARRAKKFGGGGRKAGANEEESEEEEGESDDDEEEDSEEEEEEEEEPRFDADGNRIRKIKDPTVVAMNGMSKAVRLITSLTNSL